MSNPLFESLRRNLGRFQNRKFLEAVMGVAALTAMADGQYDIAEKYQAEVLLAEIPLFDVFEMAEAMEILDGDVHALRADRAAATRELEARIAGFADDPDKAATLLRAARAIMTADGTVTADEEREFARLSELLSQDPAGLALPDVELFVR